MSLTSYRAAPPRDELLCMGPRVGGGVTAAKVRFRSPKPCNSYEPDEAERKAFSGLLHPA
jgi:hypothetical protein